MATNDYKNTTKSCEKVAKVYTCNCGKSYLHHSSLWKHKSGCKEALPIVDASNNIIIELLKQNHEFKELIVEQNKQMIVMASKMGGSTSENDDKKHDKIVKNIAKEVLIDKENV